MGRRFDWRVLAVGAAGGLLSGFFGVGGGLVLVPLMVSVLRFDRHSAHATSLAAILIIALSAMITFALAGQVDTGLGLALGAGGLVGSVVGAQILHRVSAAWLEGAFAVVLLVSGVRLLL